MNKPSQEQWQRDWHLEIQQAKSRPNMYIGSQLTAHRFAVSEALKLVWKAKAFHSPTHATVHLSPTQYIVLCQSGSLLEPIEKLYTWRNKNLLTHGWSDVQKGLREKHRLVTLDLKNDLAEWESHFIGPSGPTLESPIYPAILANWFKVAYKTSNGFWCQDFEEGWPRAASYLVKESSRIGLLTAAGLGSEWFTGLPFSHEDLLNLSKLPYVTTVWHPQNDLSEMLSKSPSDLEKWL